MVGNNETRTEMLSPPALEYLQGKEAAMSEMKMKGRSGLLLVLKSIKVLEGHVKNENERKESKVKMKGRSSLPVVEKSLEVMEERVENKCERKKSKTKVKV